MNKFVLESKFKPVDEQKNAIAKLTQGLKDGLPAQVLLGVTGSGKTFTMANVIQNLNRPALVISHNKTLAAQLYAELKEFFPHNAVEYFVITIITNLKPIFLKMIFISRKMPRSMIAWIDCVWPQPHR